MLKHVKWATITIFGMLCISSVVLADDAGAAYPAGTIIKCGQKKAIFYVASDAKRHEFPDETTYRSWFKDFSSVKKVSDSVCKKIPLGSKVTIHPGAALIKFRGSAKVYAVSAPDTLHWVRSAALARVMFGVGWERQLAVLPIASFKDYHEGSPLASPSDYDHGEEYQNTTIDKALGIRMSSGPDPLGPSDREPVCEYAAPPAGCSWVQGPDFNPPKKCMELRCSTHAPTSAPAGQTVLPSPSTPSPAPATQQIPSAPTQSPPPVTVQPPPAGTASVGVADASRVIRPSSFTQPSFNTRATEPDFGTAIRRITDRVRTGNGGFGTHMYSQLQAFSSDDQYVLLQEDDAYAVRRVDTLAAANQGDLNNINAPRWQPALAHTLVHYDGNDDATLRIQYTNVDTGRTDTMFTFPANFQRIRSNQSFDELSHDGKWMAGMAAMANGDQTIFTFNLETKTLGAQVSLNSLYSGTCARDPQYGAVEPDWIGVSPLGKYILVQWVRDGVSRCSGLETWDIQTGRYVGRVFDRHEHGDLGVDKDGVTEFFMTFENEHPSDAGRPSQSVRVLPGPATGVQAPKYLQIMDWGTQHHVSCQGPNGVCVVDAFLHNPENPGEPWHPFDEEIFLQYTDGRVLRLAHHRSSQCGYWVQPRTSISHDGKYVIFDSDWGVNRCAASNDNLGRGETYVIELPAGLAASGPAAQAAIPPSTPPAQTVVVPAPAPSSAPAQTPPPAAEPAPAPSATQSGERAVGSVGAPPQSTYMLKAGETITMALAEAPATLYLEPRVGAGTCMASDFIKYEIYAADSGSTNYTLVGRHVGADGGEFVAGGSADTGGCAKDRIIYTLALGSGTHTVVACVTNVQNPSQRICRSLTVQ